MGFLEWLSKIRIYENLQKLSKIFDGKKNFKINSKIFKVKALKEITFKIENKKFITMWNKRSNDELLRFTSKPLTDFKWFFNKKLAKATKSIFVLVYC